MQITPGSRVSTLSFFVKKARESTLEFLLINHPLDCPICDQGGECDLQDQTLVFGSDRGRFYEKKRAVKNFFAGWLIKTFMTRCIHCTRCVRFNSEIELENKIGVLGRGSSMKISNFVNARLNSGFSGNLADLCPVGALVSKPYSFTARPWELRTSTSLDLSDSLLFKVRLDIKGEEIKRVLPTTSGSLESFFISDKGRFYFDGLFYQRLVRPDFRNLRGSKTWRNSLSRTAILFLSKLGQRINLSSSRNYFFEMEFKLIGKNDFHFFEKIYQKNQTIGDKRYLMFFGPKTEKLKDVFEFSVKVNFFSKAYRFFFNAANQQSRNEGLSAEKKLFLLKGAFSALS